MADAVVERWHCREVKIKVNLWTVHRDPTIMDVVERGPLVEVRLQI